MAIRPTIILKGGFGAGVPRDDNFKHDLSRPTYSLTGFEKHYFEYVKNLLLLKNSGLKAAVYTRIADTRNEENGYLTLDRKVSKISPEVLFEMHSLLYKEAPMQKILLPASIKTPQKWEIAFTSIPTKDDIPEEVHPSQYIQTSPDFNNLEWKEALGPFGNTEGANASTSWDGKTQLIIRKTVNITNLSKELSFRIFNRLEGNGMPWMHTRIYFNGEFAADESRSIRMP